MKKLGIVLNKVDMYISNDKEIEVKIETEKNRALAIACAIIFIEFAMNVSYFMTEIGGDLQGMFLSLVAALVPTALLIAETLMLSQTKFEINACDELLSKVDKD